MCTKNPTVGFVLIVPLPKTFRLIQRDTLKSVVSQSIQSKFILWFVDKVKNRINVCQVILLFVIVHIGVQHEKKKLGEQVSGFCSCLCTLGSSHIFLSIWHYDQTSYQQGHKKIKRVARRSNSYLLFKTKAIYLNYCHIIYWNGGQPADIGTFWSWSGQRF